jgi:hypothetical protein
LNVNVCCFEWLAGKLAGHFASCKFKALLLQVFIAILNKKIAVFWDVTPCSLIEIYEITRRNIPESNTLHSHCCANLKSPGF